MNDKQTNLTSELAEQGKAIGSLQVQSNYIIDTFDKVTEKINAMGKFIADSNKAIISKLDSSTKNESMCSEQQDKLFAALINAKSEMSVEFEKTGKSHRPGLYATYGDLVHFAKPFLKTHGLDIIQEPIEAGDSDLLKTTIIHSSGQWRSSVCAVRPDYSQPQAPIQAYASALTSMKRYAYAAILNLHSGGDK